jgi:hapalindole biogenesis HpiC1 cyclase-like protein
MRRHPLARALGTFLLLQLLATTHARAAVVTVANPSFESPPLMPGQFVGGNPPGWTATGPPGSDLGNGVFNPGAAGYYTVPIPEGSNVGFVYDSAPGDGFGAYGLAQVLSDTLQPLTEYTLRVAIGDPLPAAGFNLAGFPGYRVQLLAGGVVLAQDDNSLAGTFPQGQFADSVVTFTTGLAHANLGQALEIRLINLNPSTFTAESEVDFDNVRLTATVIPEPGMLTLFGITVAAFARTSRPRCGRAQQPA